MPNRKRLEPMMKVGMPAPQICGWLVSGKTFQTNLDFLEGRFNAIYENASDKGAKMGFCDKMIASVAHDMNCADRPHLAQGTQSLAGRTATQPQGILNRVQVLRLFCHKEIAIDLAQRLGEPKHLGHARQEADEFDLMRWKSNRSRVAV
jgi:hypothetical protein